MKVSYVLRFLYFSKTSETIFSYRFPTVEELRYHPLRDSDCYAVYIQKRIDNEVVSKELGGINRFYFEGEVILKEYFKTDNYLMDNDKLEMVNDMLKKYGAVVLIRKKLFSWFNPKTDRCI